MACNAPGRVSPLTPAPCSPLRSQPLKPGEGTMFSKIFIDRPIFACVLSIVLVLAGGAAVISLPVAQYPEITPPSVSVTATYPGADAKVVAETVAAPIEQQVNGVERMLYMNSQSNSDGSYTLNV